MAVNCRRGLSTEMTIIIVLLRRCPQPAEPDTQLAWSVKMAVSGVGGTPSVPVTGADSILQVNIAQFLGDIFDQIDADADKADPTDPTNPARIDETQLAHAFNSLQLPPQVRALGASAVFSQLDP